MIAKRLLFTILLLVFATNLFAQSEGESVIESDFEPKPFMLDLPMEISLFAYGGAGWAFRFYMTHKKSDEEWDGKLYDKNDINPFDRWAARPYKKTLDDFGTISCALAAAVPIASVVASKDYLTMLVMYAETMLVASGTYSAIKTVITRNRPYMYFDGGKQSDMEDGDFENSFPSGHTTNAFAAAVFASYTFSVYNPDSPYRLPVCIAALSLASATGVLRVASGNHFISDVLAGALIGSASGFLVPYLHLCHYDKGIELSALPGGIAAKISL